MINRAIWEVKNDPSSDTVTIRIDDDNDVNISNSYDGFLTSISLNDFLNIADDIQNMIDGGDISIVTMQEE